MTTMVRDHGVELRREPGRVILRLFVPGESTPGATSRTGGVLARTAALPPEVVARGVRDLMAAFDDRHPDLAQSLRAHAALVGADAASGDASLLAGAVVSAEFSVEGTALCNPSVVAHPDQSGLADGELRVVLSLRSIGEPHLSSMQFVEATIGSDGTWTFAERRRPLVAGAVSDATWSAHAFHRALEHHGRLSELARAVLAALPGTFTASDVEDAMRRVPEQFLHHADARSALEEIRLMARSAYRVDFDEGSALSQRILLPAADEERLGVEDARFVQFAEDDGRTDYRATYTAYDGRSIATRFVRTADFRRFEISHPSGSPTRTKGMALFPRRVGGACLALSRGDGEGVSVTSSTDGEHWSDETPVYRPELLWEIVQSGNCGSPIETHDGWLVLTHGVGPMREYSIGAILLDLDDPTRVIGRLEEPLIRPSPTDRDGYVPNVVYSCGGLVHGGRLWLPYGLDDDHIRVASVELESLLSAMSPVPAEPVAVSR